jgi:transcriptional regulator with XRE-family HTH domain
VTRHPLVEAIVAARKARGWSQAELARRSYRSQKTVSYFENRPGRPDLLVLEQLARPLGLRLGLVPDDGAEAKQVAS